MATIQLIQVEALEPAVTQTYSCRAMSTNYWRWYTFKTFIDNKGRKRYFINDVECTKEEGNEKYKAIKANAKEFKSKVFTEEISYQALIDRLMKGYDQWACMIDDYSSYKSTCKHNDEILKRVDYLNGLIREEF